MAQDTKITQQNVVLEFNDYEISGTVKTDKYVFEMDDRQDPDQTALGAVRIRKYPAPADNIGGGWLSPALQNDGNITLQVTEGRLYLTSEKRWKEVIGSSMLCGDSEVELPYPVARNLNWYVDGYAFDTGGDLSIPAIGFSRYKNALVLNRPYYCNIRYSYITEYQILRYYPTIYNEFEAYYMPDPADYGQLLGFFAKSLGTEYPPAVVFAISPPPSVEAEFELYRVESIGIVKEDGIWEKPMGWPKDGSYINSKEIIDIAGGYVEMARTHEIGYFSLLNNTKRQEQHRSTSISVLPLDFTKELRYERYAGSTVATGRAYSATASDGSSVSKTLSEKQKVQEAEYFERYKRLLNNAPKMRTVHYDIPIGKPYGTESAINEAREVARNLSAMKITDSRGNIDKETEERTKTINSALKTFRIKLVVKIPARPKISTAVLRNQENQKAVDINTQAQRINTMLSMIWEGVDWESLRKRILATYDKDVYEVTFDTSFPKAPPPSR